MNKAQLETLLYESEDRLEYFTMDFNYISKECSKDIDKKLINYDYYISCIERLTNNFKRIKELME
jgi:hypothetical protein